MEEISLKECIQILLKDIKTILLVTAIAAAIALIAGLFIPKTYESTTVLRVNPIDINPAISNDGTSLLGDITAIARFPVMDINSYKEQLTNIQVLQATIDTLIESDTKASELSIKALKRNVSIKSDENTNILYITARASSAQAAADLANTLVEKFIEHLNITIISNCNETLVNINKQLETQKSKVESETAKLRKYAEGEYNAQEIQSSINGLISQITAYKTDINRLQRSIESGKLALDDLKYAGIGNTSSQFKISLPASAFKTSLSDDGEAVAGVSTGSYMDITLDNDSDVENIILTVKKAEIQASLIQDAADYTALTARLTEMETQLSSLQSLLAEEQQKYNILYMDYQLAGEIYGKYQKIYQQIPVIASSDLAKKNILILSSGTPPASPSGMGMLMYITVGIVLGLFMGIFAVFFKSYWLDA